MLQIIHLFVFHLNIILEGVSLLLRLKIVICNVQGKKDISCVRALLPVPFAVRTLCYLMVQIGRYFLQIFLSFKSAESINLSTD